MILFFSESLVLLKYRSLFSFFLRGPRFEGLKSAPFVKKPGRTSPLLAGCCSFDKKIRPVISPFSSPEKCSPTRSRSPLSTHGKKVFPPFPEEESFLFLPWFRGYIHSTFPFLLRGSEFSNAAEIRRVSPSFNELQSFFPPFPNLAPSPSRGKPSRIRKCMNRFSLSSFPWE